MAYSSNGIPYNNEKINCCYIQDEWISQTMLKERSHIWQCTYYLIVLYKSSKKTKFISSVPTQASGNLGVCLYIIGGGGGQNSDKEGDGEGFRLPIIFYF